MAEGGPNRLPNPYGPEFPQGWCHLQSFLTTIHAAFQLQRALAPALITVAEEYMASTSRLIPPASTGTRSPMTDHVCYCSRPKEEASVGTQTPRRLNLVSVTTQTPSTWGVRKIFRSEATQTGSRAEAYTTISSRYNRTRTEEPPRYRGSTGAIPKNPSGYRSSYLGRRDSDSEEERPPGWTPPTPSPRRSLVTPPSLMSIPIHPPPLSLSSAKGFTEGQDSKSLPTLPAWGPRGASDHPEGPSEPKARRKEASQPQQSPMDCWNCGSKRHTHSNCPHAPLHTYCFRCGKPDVTIKGCPNCYTQWRSEGPYRPKQPKK